MKKGCLVFLVVALLTACGRPLVTNRRTPTLARTGTTTGVVGANTPATQITTIAESTPSTASPISATETITVEGTEIAQPTESPQVSNEATLTTDGTSAPVVPTTPQVVIVPATSVPISNNERWREQELDRQPLAQPQTYTTTGSDLFWYDPVYQQHVLLGSFRGSFEVLATFTLRGTNQPALEVLYEVNQRYGLTALSPGIIERIKAAGYTDGVIDTYVIVDDNVTSR